LDGWRAFADEPPLEIKLLTEAERAMLSDAALEQYDDNLVTYHSELVVVMTSTVSTILRQGKLLIMLNRRETGARRGMMVSGDQTTGKSTAIKRFGLAHELLIRKKFPNSTRIPVVYVTCPPKGSARKLSAELARFLGLEVTDRQNATDIANKVCSILRAAKNDLVIIDEIHNLDNGTDRGSELSDHIKYLTEHLPATFAYVGIDLDHCGLFTGIRGLQLAGRCMQIDTAAIPYGAEWRGLVATMESALRLHRHEPGTLVKLDRYLHRRSLGMIGSLSHLIRGAAILAVVEGTHQITKDLLDEVQLDKIAQQGGIAR
jgi:hypothetical protein